MFCFCVKIRPKAKDRKKEKDQQVDLSKRITENNKIIEKNSRKGSWCYDTICKKKTKLIILYS